MQDVRNSKVKKTCFAVPAFITSCNGVSAYGEVAFKDIPGFSDYKADNSGNIRFAVRSFIYRTWGEW